MSDKLITIRKGSIYMNVTEREYVRDHKGRGWVWPEQEEKSLEELKKELTVTKSLLTKERNKNQELQCEIDKLKGAEGQEPPKED